MLTGFCDEHIPAHSPNLGRRSLRKDNPVHRREKITHLSKSRFITGMQCLKRLYLLCYEGQLVAEPDEETLAAFDYGTRVGELARKAFLGGVLVEEKYWDHERAVAHTLDLIADEGVPAIFEGAFAHEGIVVRVDILERMPHSRWRLIEVKSTRCVNDAHIPDVAIQKYVVEGCGVDIAQSCLMHLSREYTCGSADCDLDQLFHVEDVTAQLRKFGKLLSERLAEQRETLARISAPNVAPGPQCTAPYKCEFYDYCNGALQTTQEGK